MSVPLEDKKIALHLAFLHRKHIASWHLALSLFPSLSAHFLLSASARQPHHGARSCDPSKNSYAVDFLFCETYPSFGGQRFNLTLVVSSEGRSEKKKVIHHFEDSPRLVPAFHLMGGGGGGQADTSSSSIRHFEE